MATKQTSLADALGVSAERIDIEIKSRTPDDPEAARRAHERELLILKLAGRLSLESLLLAFALCWLFLHYGKPEQAEKVVATVIGLVGGIGIGRTTVGKD